MLQGTAVKKSFSQHWMLVVGTQRRVGVGCNRPEVHLGSILVLALARE